MAPWAQRFLLFNMTQRPEGSEVFKKIINMIFVIQRCLKHLMVRLGV
jgi:hypothetical protein